VALANTFFARVIRFSMAAALLRKAFAISPTLKTAQDVQDQCDLGFPGESRIDA